MDGIILAGGLGTRLAPVTREIPKALIPIQGRPLTDHLFDILVRAGVDRMILSLGHLSPQILERYSPSFVVDGKSLPVRWVVDEQNGTAAWIKGCADVGIELSDPLIVVNGDNLCSVDFSQVLATHRRTGALATLVLTELEDVSAYGVAQMEGERIVRFVEKPAPGDEPSHYSNTGYYVFSRAGLEAVADLFPQGTGTDWNVMLEHAVFPRLASLGGLVGEISRALWFDTGTFERWNRVIDEWQF
jgi:mannose-1-phosphate guanylyltransferase